MLQIQSNFQLYIIKTELKQLSFKTSNNYNSKRELNITKHELLVNLSKKKDLAVQHRYEGNAIALINRVDYGNSMLAMLSER